MSTYTEYLDKVEEALGTLVNDVVLKQQVDHPQLCSKRTKARILSMYLDMIPLLYNCDCVSEDEFDQIQNHIIKLTGDPEIGLIDQDDLSCGGIQTQIVHTVSSSSSGQTNVPQCGSVSLTADVPSVITFGQSLGTSGSDWVFMGTPFCYDANGYVAFGISAQSANGFTVTAVSNCTFTYCAIKK